MTFASTNQLIQFYRNNSWFTTCMYHCFYCLSKAFAVNKLDYATLNFFVYHKKCNHIWAPSYKNEYYAICKVTKCVVVSWGVKEASDEIEQMLRLVCAYASRIWHIRMTQLQWLVIWFLDGQISVYWSVWRAGRLLLTHAFIDTVTDTILKALVN